MIGYPYINMEVTIKNALSILRRTGFEIIEMVRVYHLGIMKLLPVAPAYFFVAERRRKGWRGPNPLVFSNLPASKLL